MNLQHSLFSTGFLEEPGVNFKHRARGNRTMNSPNHVITRDPEVLGGTPVFRGTRVPFQTLLEYLEGGETLDEFLDDFPSVSRELAVSALEHAKSLVVGELKCRTAPTS